MPERLQVWIDARTRHHLSDAHVQMARELGLNPKKLSKLDNHGQEPWKAPLPAFIERLYLKRFGRRSEIIVSIEEQARMEEDRMARKREMRRQRAGEDVQG